MEFALKNLKNPHTRILESIPHFYWDEVLQNNGANKYFKDRDFNTIEDPGVMRNIIQHAEMLEHYRLLIGDLPININSWYRPEVYNGIVLRESGYSSSYVSDHLCTLSCATDVELGYTKARADTWKKVCDVWGVNYNIGRYTWGMHLGWRTDRPNYEKDWR